MIKNERQYKITRAQAARFADALSAISDEPGSIGDVHPLLVQAHAEGLKSQLDELREELSEYEALKAGNFDASELLTAMELPKTLIRARIAIGWSQKNLAAHLGLKEQQIQRYEASDYDSASFSRIREVIVVLDAAGRERANAATA